MTEPIDDLREQRAACDVLLDTEDSLPAPLETELRGYALRLDYAMNEAVPPPELVDTDALDAIAGLLLRPGATDPETLNAVRDIIHRNGRSADS